MDIHCAIPKTMRSIDDAVTEYVDAMESVIGPLMESQYQTPDGYYLPDKPTGDRPQNEPPIISDIGMEIVKSAFVQWTMEHVAAQQRTVILFSPGICHREIVGRAMSLRSGIPTTVLETADYFTDAEWGKICDALGRLVSLPLLIDDASSNIADIVSRAKAAVSSLEVSGLPPLGLIIVDCEEFMGEKAANSMLKTSCAPSSLNQLAKELSVPVLFFCCD